MPSFLNQMFEKRKSKKCLTCDEAQNQQKSRSRTNCILMLETLITRCSVGGRRNTTADQRTKTVDKQQWLTKARSRPIHCNTLFKYLFYNMISGQNNPYLKSGNATKSDKIKVITPDTASSGNTINIETTAHLP